MKIEDNATTRQVLARFEEASRQDHKPQVFFVRYKVPEGRSKFKTIFNAWYNSADYQDLTTNQKYVSAPKRQLSSVIEHQGQNTCSEAFIYGTRDVVNDFEALSQLVMASLEFEPGDPENFSPHSTDFARWIYIVYLAFESKLRKLDRNTDYDAYEFTLNPASMSAMTIARLLSDSAKQGRLPVSDGPQLPQLFYWKDKKVELSPMEWKVVDLLWRQPNRTEQQAFVRNSVWGEEGSHKTGLESVRARLNAKFIKVGIPFELVMKKPYVTLEEIK